jgi:hypothetical protein
MSVSRAGSMDNLLDQLENLHWRVKYLKHADELNLTVLENVIARFKSAQNEWGTICNCERDE